MRTYEERNEMRELIADMFITLDGDLSAGYRGYFDCRA